jgi:hypothetical protein
MSYIAEYVQQAQRQALLLRAPFQQENPRRSAKEMAATVASTASTCTANIAYTRSMTPRDYLSKKQVITEVSAFLEVMLGK